MRAVFWGQTMCTTMGVLALVCSSSGEQGPTPSPKEKGCSTVLIPAKVVQALNLNLDKMGSQPLIQPRFVGRFASENDGSWRIRSGRQVTPQPMGSHHLLQAAVSQEISLQQEWTY